MEYYLLIIGDRPFAALREEKETLPGRHRKSVPACFVATISSVVENGHLLSRPSKRWKSWLALSSAPLYQLFYDGEETAAVAKSS